MAADELIDLEERGWRARLTDRDTIVGSMGGQPWASYRLEDPQSSRTGRTPR
jgi:hypothetical protein